MNRRGGLALGRRSQWPTHRASIESPMDSNVLQEQLLPAPLPTPNNEEIDMTISKARLAKVELESRKLEQEHLERSTVTLLLTPSRIDELQEIAVESGMSLAEMVSEIVEHWFSADE